MAFAALDVTKPQQLFTHCCDLIPGRSDFRKERFLVAHSPRMQSVMVGEALQEEHEVAGSRERRTWVLSSLPFDADQDPSL